MTTPRLLTSGMSADEARGLATGLIVADGRLRQEIQAEAAPLGLKVVLQDGSGLDAERVREAGLRLLIVDACPPHEPLEAMVRRLKSACPEMLIAVVHAVADAGLIVAALRAGADEFIFPPVAAGLRTALDHLQVKLGRRRAAGRVLGVVSAKGGCGATTIACHLALALERLAMQNVLLADLHLDGGLVGFLMGARTPYSMMDAARNTHRLDESFFKGLVSSRTPRLDIIPAPAGADLQTVPVEPLREAVRAVRSMYGWVILDLGSGFNGIVAPVLDDLDDLLVVSTPDLPALYLGKRLIGHLVDLGWPRSRLHAIFNRVPRHHDLSPGELRDLIGLGAHIEVRECRELADAYADGKLAGAESELGRSMAALAAQLSGIPPAARKRRMLKLPWAS